VTVTKYLFAGKYYYTRDELNRHVVKAQMELEKLPTKVRFKYAIEYSEHDESYMLVLYYKWLFIWLPVREKHIIPSYNRYLNPFYRPNRRATFYDPSFFVSACYYNSIWAQKRKNIVFDKK